MTILSLHGGRFSYRRIGPSGGQVDTVLDQVDLSISSGARIALLGGNGSGKTTLLRLLVGLASLESGVMELDGTRVRNRRSDRVRLRESVQMVLQEPDDQIFATSVRADVSFGPVNLGLPPEDVETRVDEALESLSITDLADRVPHHLSFGQRKRVALAGALAMQPRVLLLDEPTAGLDPLACGDLMAELDALHESGTAIFMATHDVDLAWAWADEAVVLVDGRLVRGTAHKVLRDPELLASARLSTPWGAVVSHRLGRTVRHPGEV